MTRAHPWDYRTDAGGAKWRAGARVVGTVVANSPAGLSDDIE
ncbi:hypothetical protein GJR88_02057 [Dietzia sp. DQ12-45-1b]|nr:hypothetical protein GJR88_02057 [Dietzia sp. DQ12-45-1b]